MKKTLIKTAIVAAIGATAVVSAPANATINTFDWQGIFTMLDADGAALANTSTTLGNTGVKGANQFQTPVSGTMSFDMSTGAGTATLVPFDFFANDPTAPAEAVGIEMQAIGDGFGDSTGTLVLGNMLFNWNGNNGIPVSLVLDAAGFFNGAQNGDMNDGVLDQTDVAGYGAIPASDGTYLTGVSPISEKTGTDGRVYPASVDVGGYQYLGLGPVPISTTAWNTTNGAGCLPADCAGVSPSGVLPMVLDTRANANDFIANTGGTIGGNPMQSGAFINSNANFDILTLTATGQEAGTIGPFCSFDPSGNLCAPPEIPVPAAVWLFGSGLLGLVGVARRKKSQDS